jgi:hypothetical protein
MFGNHLSLPFPNTDTISINQRPSYFLSRFHNNKYYSFSP